MEIEYGAEPGAEVEFDIFTITVKYVISLKPKAGESKVYWDGRNKDGKEVASGIYLMIMRVNGEKVGEVVKVGYLKR